MTFAPPHPSCQGHDLDPVSAEPPIAHPLRLRLGCEMGFAFAQPTPMIAMVNIHYSRVGDLERPDHLTTTPNVPVRSYRDLFGNWCCRFMAPAGEFTIGTDSIIRDSGLPDATFPEARQHEIEDLPPSTLTFLLPSRYCESDMLMHEAWSLFGGSQPGWARVQAICDFVHGHVRFDYQLAHNQRTAAQTYQGRCGVCRDYTHLAIAFCRAVNIPAMYCNGYISDVGQPLPYATQDFCAWMRVYLDGRWIDVDPRNNRPMYGRVLVSTGRDAADVPLTHSFGWGALNRFRVWVDELAPPPGGHPAPP